MIHCIFLIINLSQIYAGISGTYPHELLNSPGFLAWKSVLRCNVDGRSLRRSDSCLLNGEFFWLRAGNPRNEPWRTSCSIGAWRRGMAWGPPGSGRSMGDAAPSGGEAVPGGRDGMTTGWSAGGDEYKYYLLSFKSLLKTFSIFFFNGEHI